MKKLNLPSVLTILATKMLRVVCLIARPKICPDVFQQCIVKLTPRAVSKSLNVPKMIEDTDDFLDQVGLELIDIHLPLPPN